MCIHSQRKLASWKSLFPLPMAERSSNTPIFNCSMTAQMTEQCGCAVISIYKLIYFQVVFIFNFQRLFPVLEEDIFAKNIAFIHVSSILSHCFGFSHLLVWVPAHLASHLQCPGWASAQHKLKVPRGLHLVITSYSLKTLRPNG